MNSNSEWIRTKRLFRHWHCSSELYRHVAFHATCRIVRRGTTCLPLLPFGPLFSLLPLFKPTDVTLLSLRSLKRARRAIERVDVETLRIDHGKSQRRFLLALVLAIFSRVSRCPHVFRENTEHGTFYFSEALWRKSSSEESSNSSFFTERMIWTLISVFYLFFSTFVLFLL